MSNYGRGGSSPGGDFAQMVSSFVNYLKTRQPEHWLFFAVGVIVGILIG